MTFPAIIAFDRQTDAYTETCSHQTSSTLSFFEQLPFQSCCKVSFCIFPFGLSLSVIASSCIIVFPRPISHQHPFATLSTFLFFVITSKLPSTLLNIYPNPTHTPTPDLSPFLIFLSAAPALDTIGRVTLTSNCRLRHRRDSEFLEPHSNPTFIQPRSQPKPYPYGHP